MDTARWRRAFHYSKEDSGNNDVDAHVLDEEGISLDSDYLETLNRQ